MTTAPGKMNYDLPGTGRNPQQDTKYVGVCDGMRVLAIGIVAWFHIWQQSWLWPGFHAFGREINLDPLIRSGYMWVDLMILISGFCLYLPWARLKPQDPSPRILSFYKRRVARIFPSYILNVVIVFAFSCVAGFYADRGRAIRDLLAHLTFTQVFSYDTYYATPINAGLWTIAVEVHFYLVFPFLARLFRKAPFSTAGAMIAISLSYRAWVAVNVSDIGIWFNQLIAYLDVFALGMLAALFHVRLSAVPHRRWMRLIFGAAAIFSLWMLFKLAQAQSRSVNVEEIRLGQMQRRFFMGCFGSLMLLGLAHTGKPLCTVFSNRLMKFLSGISMQFYIWHQVIAVQVLRARIIPSAFADPNYAGDQLWQGRYTLAVVVIALTVSTVLTYAFERPIARRILIPNPSGD